VIWFDRRLDPAERADQHVAGGVGQRRNKLLPTPRSAARTGIPTTNSSTSGAFIGDYNGLAASTEAVYAVWTDGRDSARAVTGIGETDIFTTVQSLTPTIATIKTTP